MPEVSIIVPVHNPPEQYIYEALESILSQSFKDFEIIVVDDGSTGNTEEILFPYRESIRYFKKENGGVNTARLFGLNKAKGQYVALLDQDDVWVSHKLKRQVDFLNANPEIDLIFSDFHNFNDRGFIGGTFFDTNEIIRRIPTEPATKGGLKCNIFTKNLLYEYLRGNFIIQCTIMARTAVCKKYMMFETETNGREFYEFGTRALHLLKLGFIDEVLAYRRIHSNNVTHNWELYLKNTITICRGAIIYPWMDSKCQRFLKKELINACFGLGKYYFVKGRFPEARNTLRCVFKKQFHLHSIILFYLTYISIPSVIFLLKRAKKYILEMIKN